MTDTEQKTMRRVVSLFVRSDWSDEDNRLVNTATYTLHFGPVGPDTIIEDDWTYPGDAVAHDRAAALYLAIPSTLYYEPDAEWCGEHKPEGCEDDDGEWCDPPDYVELDRADVAKLVFGREFFDNILKCYC